MKQTILGLLFAAALSPCAMGTTIYQVTGGGTMTVANGLGQNFITPAGGPWTSIAFNFFADVTDTTPVAEGTAYLLSQEYLGTRAALSSATPGFIASADAVGNEFVFGAGVTLLANTQYWIYETGSFSYAGGGAGSSSQQAYSAAAHGGSFTPLNTTADFRLTSNVGQVPEPGTLAMLGGGLALIGAFGVRRRR